jgi:hypothetical protein
MDRVFQLASGPQPCSSGRGAQLSHELHFVLLTLHRLLRYSLLSLPGTPSCINPPFLQSLTNHIFQILPNALHLDIIDPELFQLPLSQGSEVDNRMCDKRIRRVKLHPRIIHVNVPQRSVELVVDDRAFGFGAELEGEVSKIAHGTDGVQYGFNVIVEGKYGCVAEVAQIVEEGGERDVWIGMVEGGEEGGRLAEEVFVLAVCF